MVDTNKLLYLDNVFVSEKSAEDGQDTIYISGYASTTDADRQGDIVPSSVWEKGLGNYLKNPVILAYHNHSTPVGRMVEHTVDSKGLWIKARISSAAGSVYNLIKDGVLSAFSIGFRVLDATYDAATDLFVVKELELHEISVVSVPANQNTLFSLSKSFKTEDEYNSFKMHFAPQGETVAKGLESSVEAEGNNIIKGWNMTPEEIKQMMADAAKQAAMEAAKSIRAQAEQEAAQKAAADKAEQELQARIKAAVAAVTPTETGAEKLLAEVEKRFAEQAESNKSAIAGLQAEIVAKSAELEAVQKSKMSFAGDKGGMSYDDKEKAVILAKMSGKALEATNFGKQMVEKYGAHVPSATWEREVSMRMEDEVRRRLVVAPLMRSIAMQTNVMTIPVNPEAGVATWVQNSAFGTSGSAGNNATHALSEITLNSYKIATNEYVAFEEEEDALLAIMPVVRDAMVRRVARGVDLAFLRGAGAGADPVKGLATYATGASATTSIAANASATVAELRALRAKLGLYGLDPSEVAFVVSQDVYFALLEDSTFQTMDKVGSQATLITGQIGSVGNSPVLVSGEFAATAEGAIGAVAVNASNFIAGNQRGLRVDTQDLVETQRKVLVASLRTGMTQITANQGVAALVYSAAV